MSESENFILIKFETNKITMVYVYPVLSLLFMVNVLYLQLVLVFGNSKNYETRIWNIAPHAHLKSSIGHFIHVFLHLNTLGLSVAKSMPFLKSSTQL